MTGIEISGCHGGYRQIAMPLMAWSDSPWAMAVSGNQSQVPEADFGPHPPGVGLCLGVDGIVDAEVALACDAVAALAKRLARRGSVGGFPEAARRPGVSTPKGL